MLLIAAVANRHRLSGCENTTPLSYSAGGRRLSELKSRCPQSCAPSGGWKRRISLFFFCFFQLHRLPTPLGCGLFSSIWPLLLWPHLWLSSPVLSSKGVCDDVGTTWVMQGYFFILRPSLKHICKVPFAWKGPRPQVRMRISLWEHLSVCHSSDDEHWRRAGRRPFLITLCSSREVRETTGSISKVSPPFPCSLSEVAATPTSSEFESLSSACWLSPRLFQPSNLYHSKWSYC